MLSDQRLDATTRRTLIETEELAGEAAAAQGTVASSLPHSCRRLDVLVIICHIWPAVHAASFCHHPSESFHRP